MAGKGWDKLVKRVAQQIYDGRLKPDSIHPDMVKQTAQELMAGINIGYGKSFASEGLNNTQYQTLHTLEKNVFHFSGAKNWNQLREMSALLGDKKGGLKPFNEYLKDVQQIDATYNKTYLKAEYANAVTSAQMIDKWQQIEAEKDALPFLEWVTEISERTCPLCEALNGIKLPVGDPFWRKNGIPRHFHCHCDWRQLDSATVTDLSKKKIPETAPMFRSNPGVTGVAFTDKHPYFESIPEKAKKDIFIASEKLMPQKEPKQPPVSEAIQQTRKVLARPLEKQYNTLELHENGGELREHQLVKKEQPDYPYLIDYGKMKSEVGNEIDLLPEIHVREPLRDKVLPDTKFGKNPDLKINGEYWELETPTKPLTKSKLIKRIGAGARQADNVIVYLLNKVGKSQQYKIAKSRFNSPDHPDLKTISFYFKGKETIWYRNKMK